MDKLFTVVLDRPLILAEAADIDTWENIYVAIGIDGSNDCKVALQRAQAEAYAADVQSWGLQAMRRWELSPRDYQLLVMFPGRIEPCAYSFQMKTR